MERVMGGTVSDVGSKVVVSSAAPLLLGVTMKPHEGPARDRPSSEPWGHTAPGTQWPISSVDLGDFPCRVAKLLCVGPSAEGSTHTHKAPCPVLVLSGFTQGSLSLAPGTQTGLPPAPSLQHHAATSLGRRGQGAWTHCLQVPPGASFLLPACPGAAPGSDKCQGKAPSCTMTHPASPVVMLWLLPSLLPCSMALVPRAGGQGQQWGQCQ